MPCVGRFLAPIPGQIEARMELELIGERKPARNRNPIAASIRAIDEREIETRAASRC